MKTYVALLNLFTLVVVVLLASLVVAVDYAEQREPYEFVTVQAR